MGSASYRELSLHQRLMARDETATIELSGLYYFQLIEQVIKKYGRVLTDEDTIASIVGDVILDYGANPHKYNPDKSSLYGYLKMAVDGDIKNLLKGQTKGKRRLKSKNIGGSVELDSLFRNSIVREVNDPATNLITTEDEERSTRAIEALFPDPADRELVNLMRSGTRETEPYAIVLEITHLSIIDQRKKVKQHKDRIKKKLYRFQSQSS